jgi:hypothetical protein
MARCSAETTSGKQCSRTSIVDAKSKNNLCWQHSTKGETKGATPKGAMSKGVLTKGEKKTSTKVEAKGSKVSKKVVPKKAEAAKTKTQSFKSPKRYNYNDWFNYEITYLLKPDSKKFSVITRLLPIKSKWDSRMFDYIDYNVKDLSANELEWVVRQPRKDRLNDEWGKVKLDISDSSVYLDSFYNYVVRDISEKNREKWSIPMERFKGVMTTMLCQTLRDLIKNKYVTNKSQFHLTVGGQREGMKDDDNKLAAYYTKMFGVKVTGKTFGQYEMSEKITKVIDKCDMI